MSKKTVPSDRNVKRDGLFDRNNNKTDIIEINLNYICFVFVFKLSFLVIEDINFQKFLIIFY